MVLCPRECSAFELMKPEKSVDLEKGNNDCRGRGWIRSMGEWAEHGMLGWRWQGRGTGNFLLAEGISWPSLGL